MSYGLSFGIAELLGMSYGFWHDKASVIKYESRKNFNFEASLYNKRLLHTDPMCVIWTT